MDCRLTIWNYRCFGERKPASIVFSNGFHAYVGLNNMGKSTLLRFVYEARSLFLPLASPGWSNLIQNAHSFVLQGPTDSIQAAEMFNSRGRGNLRARLELLKAGEQDVAAVDMELMPDNRCRYSLPISTPSGGLWEDESGGFVRYRHGSSIYSRQSIGALAQAAADLSRAMYFPAFRSPTTGGSGQKWYDIFLGSQLVSQLRQMETSGDRRTRDRFEETESALARVLGIPDLRISPVQEKSVVNVRANGTSHALHELGSGIGQFIAAAASVALQQPTYLLVDEPEIHLHPSLQVEYLSLLAANASRGVLFATHALGLARTVTHRISLVRRDDASKDSVVLPLEHGTNPVELLGALQYGAYHTVGMRAVLLVEGPGDCLVFRQWLRLLGKDTEVLVLPLGGKSLINGKSHQVLDDIRRFGSRVNAVIDSEKPKPDSPLEQARQDFLAACATLDIRAIATERRATENYFSEASVRRAFPSASYALFGPHELRPSGTWAKDDNWRIARCMTKDELLDTDIGKFLDQI